MNSQKAHFVQLNERVFIIFYDFCSHLCKNKQYLHISQNTSGKSITKTIGA